MANWNATQYLKFEKERTQPALDLAKRIHLEHPSAILDVGCGPGNSTAVLAQLFPNAEILGIDSSQNMIEKAKQAYPHLTFSLCDAGKDSSSLGKKFDVVYSNACLQWIPNHPVLLKTMTSLLNPNGVLAVQVPSNEAEPLYQIIAEAAANEKWGFSRLRLEPNEVLRPADYFDVLSGLSGDFSVWTTTYFHRMQSHADLLEWVKSTRLRPYLNALSTEQGEQFTGEILEKTKEAYTPQKNGEIIFPFRRLFFTAVAPAAL